MLMLADNTAIRLKPTARAREPYLPRMFAHALPGRSGRRCAA
jgi:hypothetical protein